MKAKIKLFLTAFLQVFFVAANTFLVSQKNYPGALVCGFAISWLWTSNVKRISIGSTGDRLAYASGAAIGTIFGLFIGSRI